LVLKRARKRDLTMNYTILGAALLVALLFASPALDMLNFKPFGDRRRGKWRSLMWDLWASEVGAVSVTYYINGIPINGSTTAPTAIQASQAMKQSARVVFGVTADAQALFTHNWGLSASAPGYLEPEILVDLISTTTYYPLLTFDRTNTNVLAINKPATDGPTTIVVTIRRPHSTGQ
jgi:hypothetical protein